MPIVPPSLDIIKVGYISEPEGDIKDVSIADANAYEKLNPGTSFIFIGGDKKVKYLSIDEVNALTVKDLLKPDPCDSSPQPCGPPTLNFFGGGGVGAEANPVVDENGEIIAADIVSGGFGYTSPPQVQVIDPCNNGSGAVLQTEIKNGSVIRIIINDSGFGYLPPAETAPQYPALIKLTEVIVKNPGINYDCGVDELTITPANGTVLSYKCDPFGKIRSIDVVKGGNYTSLPNIYMNTYSGLNASFTPVFEVIRDPLTPEVASYIVQVYDLVGLNINGYVNGKPYYGNVFFENGLKYAGTQTSGRTIRVYDTSQESTGGS